MSLVVNHIGTILLVIGILTCTLLLQAVVPKFALKVSYKIETSDPLLLFFARAAAIPIVMIGVLLIGAAYNESIRPAAVMVAFVGKAAFLAAIFASWSHTGKAFMLTIAVDTISVLLLGAYLLQI